MRHVARVAAGVPPMTPLEASIAVDALVAELVLGWEWVTGAPDRPPSPLQGYRRLIDPANRAYLAHLFRDADMDLPIFHNPRIPPFSSDTAEGWGAMRELVQRLERDWLYVTIGYKGGIGRWVCTLSDGRYRAPEWQPISEAATTAPMAVALAAITGALSRQ